MPNQKNSKEYQVRMIYEPRHWNDECFRLCKPNPYKKEGTYFDIGGKKSPRGLKSFIEQHHPILHYANENVEKAVEKALSQPCKKPAKTLDDLTN